MDDLNLLLHAGRSLLQEEGGEQSAGEEGQTGAVGGLVPDLGKP